MKRFLNRMSNAGIHPGLTLQQARTIGFLNSLSLLVVLLIFLNLLFSITGAPLTFPGKLLIAILLVHAVLIAMTIRFNFQRRYLLARIYFGCVAVSFMCIYALLMGDATRWAFFLPIIILLQFYIFPAEEKKWMYTIIVYCVLGFTGCEWWFLNHTSLLDFPPAIITSFRYINAFGFLFCAVGLGMMGFITINRAEKKLEEEHLRSEQLLLNVLPAPIARRLKESSDIIVDRYANVTVLFADIVGFTKLAGNISPDKLIMLLNVIFSKFDELAGQFGLEKIKTIGDAYMVVAGLPDEKKDHAEVAAAMGLAMLDAIKKLNSSGGYNVNVRIGICSGPVVAGVIGTKKFAYDLWGDSVNTAARMESHGISGEIQVAESTFQLLENKYSFECRGMIDVKGKGLMKTYLLKGNSRH